MQHRRVSITPEGAHELRVYPRVSLEMIGDAGAVLDFAEKMPERRRAEPVKAFDEALATKPPGRRKLGLLRGRLWGYSGIVSLEA